MQLTPRFNLRIIEVGDPFTIDTLNHNARKTEENFAKCLMTDVNGTAGKFDHATNSPTAENPLRYNGIFRATKLFGVYYSNNADIAEVYDITGEYKPGDLIAICEDGYYRINTIPGNCKILGIVSTSPGLCLGGEPSNEKAAIALVGRVPANVEGDVNPGDYLMAGDKPGHLKAIDINRAPKGAICAIALSKKDYNSEKCEVFVTRM